MREKQETLATMWPPSGDSKRRAPPSPLVASLQSLLLNDPRASSLGDARNAMIAFQVDDGRNVLVSLKADRIDLAAVLEDANVHDEEHDTFYEDEWVNEPVEELACELLETLQAATGFYVESDYGGFDPRGPCASCGFEAFDWEERCATCGTWFDTTEDDADDLVASSLARVAPPDEHGASRWHRPSPPRTIEALLVPLLRIRLAKTDQRSDTLGVVTIPVDDGDKLRIYVRRDGIDIEVAERVPSETTSDRVDRLAAQVLSSLQSETRWYVSSDAYPHFEPCGACPKCRIEVFEWQRHCDACQTPIPEDWLPQSRLVAKFVVQKLLEDELIELADNRADLVGDCIAGAIRVGQTSAERMLSDLCDLEAVDEVFVDEATLETLVQSAAGAANGMLEQR